MVENRSSTVRQFAERSMREQATYWRDPDIAGLELLRATYVEHRFARHAHEGFAVGVVERGVQTFVCRGASHITPPGHIILVNPGEPHTGEAVAETGYTYRMLYPETALLRRAASEAARRDRDIPFFAAPVVYDPPLARTIVSLHAALEEPIGRLERETRFLDVFTRLIARHADEQTPNWEASKERRAVTLVREYLEANYAQNVTLDLLADLAGLSRFRLLHVFRDEIGLPPYTYLTQVRIARAKALLAAGMPAAAAASETGFADQSHLTRHFKRLVGVTPGRYARGAKS